MKENYLQLNIIICLIIIFISCTNNDNYILNETFDKNTRGWIEESSDYHSLFIDSGYYFIESIDTSPATFRSSTGSLDYTYLLNLPEKFEIESKMKLVKNDLEDVYYGMLLYGATFQYSFNIYQSGIVEVLEYNYNSENEYILLADTSDYEFEGELTMKILIDSLDFSLFVENHEIGGSNFKVKSWQELRLFTSKQSKVAIDYLTIKKTE